MTTEVQSIIIFVAVQLVNVIISTIKSVLTVNGSRWTATWINTVSYTFAAVITKMITEQSFAVVIAATATTNLVGVYIGRLITDKTRQTKLWTVQATLRGAMRDDVECELRMKHIQYTLIPALNDRYFISIFSYSKNESRLIERILGKRAIPFTITENRRGF